jgi:acyl-CoA synthetase (AMP-forming)/AMP-acid ligase II
VSALIGALVRHAAERPEALALAHYSAHTEPAVMRWAELRRCAEQVAARVLAQAGERACVLLVARSSIETQVCLLGGLWAGADVLPVSPLTTPSELRDLAKRAGVSLAIADGAAAAKLAALDLPVLPLETASGSSGSKRLGARSEPEASVVGTGSILLQSSGTTGLPKIVQRGAAALDATGRMLQAAFGLGPGDRLLLTLPQYHSYGIDTGLLASVIAGCELEIHEKFVPAAVRSALLERRITVWPAVPLMLDLVSRLALTGAARHSLRCAVSAGSPLSVRVAAQFEARVGVRVSQIYGASEFGSVTFGDARSAAYVPGTVGLPLPGVALQVRSPGDGPSLPAGSEGELWVAAPSMMSRYLDDAERPAADGFLRTGDLGRLDERGALTLTGRLKLLIDVAGQSINPLELEACLNLHPGVLESVVVAMPHSDTSERLKAIVVPEPGARPDPLEILRHARLHLARSKVPRAVEIRDEVPRTPTGKINRRELQRREREGEATP